MRQKIDHYTFYKKLRKMIPEKPVTETLEYTIIANNYPHIAESIRLNKEIETLEAKLKLEKDKTSRSRMKREIDKIKTKQKRERILKRLRRESGQEARWSRRLLKDAFQERICSLIQKGRMTVDRQYSNLEIGLHRFMHGRLPPSFFDLRSLCVAEKGLALREWVQTHRRRR